VFFGNGGPQTAPGQEQGRGGRPDQEVAPIDSP
jgi:hypothetical protein